MLRKGERVAQLTKKVGQVPRTGVVTGVRGESVEIKWDDGHSSVVSRISLVPVPKK